jgi:small subunit ribosomal protein S16
MARDGIMANWPPILPNPGISVSISPMLKIRLQRVGKKNDPSFRLVLIEHKYAARSGKAKEILGSHDFRKDGTIIKKDRIEYWLGQGVQVSDTAHNLLVTQGVLKGKKKNVLPKKTAPKKEAPVEEPKAAAAPAPEAAPTPAAEEVPTAEAVPAEEVAA